MNSLVMHALLDIKVEILAEVRDGSLISLDETAIIDKQIGRKLNWEEIKEDRQEAGNYFQTVYKAVVFYEDAIKINPDLLGYW